MQKNMTPGRRKGCPNYSPEFKQQLVAASCEPGISISKLALENGINANLLFKWRQQWREGKLLLPSSESPQLLPVTLDATAVQPEPPAEDSELSISCEVTFRHGTLRLNGKRTARTVLTGMCYSVGSVMRQGSSSLTRLTGQSAMTSRTWRR
ncbi:IS66-like element accessory protein TnpA [Klebsiella quasipneumoniae]|uniref:IS66-like element accessory protein TnpA n=4 Tax=Klebsiella quasipneumoniae TaxID=1463165 RepID=UPI002B400201|nr:transposase [Klebsiella quasipneumoniae]